MRNLIKITFIFIVCLLINAEKANAVILDSQFITDRVRSEVSRQVSERIHGKIFVEIKNVPYKSLEVPDGQVRINVIMNQNVFTPVTVVRVNVLVNGDQVETFGIPVKITVTDNVWVAKGNITRGSSLTSSNIILQNKDISLLAETASRAVSDINNSIAKKTFWSGDIIDARYVDTAPTVRKNSFVSIIFKTQDITIVAEGEALEDGKIGDYVKVKNQRYKTEYTGKVVSANTILVNI